VHRCSELIEALTGARPSPGFAHGMLSGLTAYDAIWPRFSISFRSCGLVGAWLLLTA
jgi:hypothetical protein